ncbi:hypothetical protein D348_01156 [Enterococcus faecalis SLO2C-1]|nr:hypothetical protein D348_01156 [Enterococcus faecalis SLO2C-1]
MLKLRVSDLALIFHLSNNAAENKKEKNIITVKANSIFISLYFTFFHY